jgi:hypothetical protein
MQIFGKFTTNFDMDYINGHYIYFNESDEDQITGADVEQMLKKKRKSVCGTIILYNPELTPVGYSMSHFLQEDGFDKYDEFVPLNEDAMSYVINAGLKNIYPGKLVEIKYLFSYNRSNIAPTPIIEEFDADIDKLTSTQFTRYDRELNYIDVPNIRLSGKFVFLGMGHKYDRHHKAIIAYARSLAQQVTKLGKQVVFLHDNNYDPDEAIEMAYFLSPQATGKMKEIRANAFKEIFKETPHKVVKIRL